MASSTRVFELWPPRLSALPRAARRGVTLVAGAIVAALIVIALLAPVLAPYSPEAQDLAIENRNFLIRACRFLSTQTEVSQFLDCGSGLPTASNRSRPHAPRSTDCTRADWLRTRRGSPPRSCTTWERPKPASARSRPLRQLPHPGDVR